MCVPTGQKEINSEPKFAVSLVLAVFLEALMQFPTLFLSLVQKNPLASNTANFCIHYDTYFLLHIRYYRFLDVILTPIRDVEESVFGVGACSALFRPIADL